MPGRDAALPLKLQTPARWAHQVLAQPLELLNDHAHLEKKAATNALDLLNRWPREKPPESWVEAITAVARDEVEHLAVVCRILARRGGKLTKSHANQYATDLRKLVRVGDGNRELADRLLISALIEARSCERFKLLAAACQEEEPTSHQKRARQEASSADPKRARQEASSANPERARQEASSANPERARQEASSANPERARQEASSADPKRARQEASSANPERAHEEASSANPERARQEASSANPERAHEEASIADPELGKLYRGLWASEHGHYLTFVALAQQVDDPPAVQARWQWMLESEALIMHQQTDGPRMHSGC